MPAKVFQRFSNQQQAPSTMVHLVLYEVESSVMADVIWQRNTQTDGGNYFYPTYVPLAIERAEDVKDHYGFEAVAVILDDVDLWNEAWGTLKT